MYPFVIENGSNTCSLIGSTEELHDIMIAAAEKRWQTDIIAVKDYNPIINGVFDVLTKNGKRS